MEPLVHLVSALDLFFFVFYPINFLKYCKTFIKLFFVVMFYISGSASLYYLFTYFFLRQCILLELTM